MIGIIEMSKADSEQYRVLRNRDDVRKFFFNSTEISKEAQEMWFEKYKKDKSQKMFSIYEDEIFIGALGIYDINIKEKKAEIGRIIIDSKKRKQKGNATIAISLVCEYAKSIGLEEIYAYIYRDNIASIKSFEHAGFMIDDTISDNDKCYAFKKLVECI